MSEPELDPSWCVPLTMKERNWSFSCPDCPEIFQTLEYLVAHHKDAHELESHSKLLKFYVPALHSLRQTCVFCNNQFSAKTVLNQHYKYCKWAKSVGFKNIRIEQLRGILAWNADLWLPKIYYQKVFWYIARNDIFVNPEKYEEKENLESTGKRRKTSDE